ncbi:MAG: hypothetical protein JOY90_20735 [Bradyrhizobium sp.]|uniref:hypothetical protein n=1 Tax=Bradyrhizobium sp. TaxID=376 RepID=UPI001DD98213|nr:hypothetical protein [Bradyrhizobium sp.]MBV9562842.1 hypothetical protein [Bradyrhizobium sp.]
MPTATIMVAALMFLIGFQLMLSFLNYAISSSPREALHPFLKSDRAPTDQREVGENARSGRDGARLSPARASH